MPKFIANVSALAAMTGQIVIDADTPKDAALVAETKLADTPVDWEFIDGGRPALGSEAVDSIRDEHDEEDLYLPSTDEDTVTAALKAIIAEVQAMSLDHLHPLAIQAANAAALIGIPHSLSTPDDTVIHPGWSGADAEVAEAEGWNVFECGDGQLVIQASGGAEGASNITAHKFVERRAAENNETAKRALAAVKESEDRMWMQVDQETAAKEGWGVFDHSERGLEIEVIDDPQDGSAPKFEGDNDAEDHVRRHAADGSEFHRKALRLVNLAI